MFHNATENHTGIFIARTATISRESLSVTLCLMNRQRLYMVACKALCDKKILTMMLLHNSPRPCLCIPEHCFSEQKNTPYA